MSSVSSPQPATGGDVVSLTAPLGEDDGRRMTCQTRNRIENSLFFSEGRGTSVHRLIEKASEFDPLDIPSVKSKRN